MFGVNLKNWWWLAALPVISCRSHRVLCEAEECQAAAVVGEAGSSADGAEKAAGGAGGAPSVECTNDTQCQDDEGCNGSERCVSGSCESGDALVCTHGTACSEQAVARCVYELPSPWLLTVGTGKIRGLPVGEIEKRELPVIAEREVKQALTGFDGVTFSPNGKVAFVHSLEDQFGSSMQLLRFGQGLPSPLLEIPDLPNWGDFATAPRFSPDSSRALVYDGFSGTYVVDLSDDPRPTELLPGGSGFGVEAFCQDSRYWLELGDDSAYYIASALDRELPKRRLGHGYVELSSDAGLVALQLEDDEGNAAGVRLFSCSGADWVASFDEATDATFGPGAQLLLRLAAGGIALASLEDPQHPVQVWSSPVAELSYDHDFTRDGTKLLLELPEANDELALHVVDLTRPSEPVVSALRLPPQAEVAVLGESSVLAWSTGFTDEPRDLLWQTLEVPSDAQQVMPEPLLVYSDASQDVTRTYPVPFDEKSVLLARWVDEQTTTISLLRFDGALQEARQLATFPSGVRAILAVADGRGLVVQTGGATIDNKVWWISLSPAGEPSEPAQLAEESLYVSLQPWR
jgi:hypothetical protein